MDVRSFALQKSCPHKIHPRQSYVQLCFKRNVNIVESLLRPVKLYEIRIWNTLFHLLEVSKHNIKKRISLELLLIYFIVKKFSMKVIMNWCRLRDLSKTTVKCTLTMKWV